jgi:xanthosine utilization system XapX-like protein
MLSPGAPDDEVMELDAPSSGAEEMSLGEPLAKSPPMEIVVGSPTDIAPQEEDSPQGVYLAPLGRRFLAGLTDAFVLLTGAAVFGVIFWRVCGRMSPAPLNIAVLGFVAILLIFAFLRFSPQLRLPPPVCCGWGATSATYKEALLRCANRPGEPLEFWFHFPR